MRRDALGCYPPAIVFSSNLVPYVEDSGRDRNSEASEGQKHHSVDGAGTHGHEQMITSGILLKYVDHLRYYFGTHVR